MFGIFSFIGWLIIGAIISWIAGKVWVGHGFGLIGNMVVGIVGSIYLEVLSLAGSWAHPA